MTAMPTPFCRLIRSASRDAGGQAALARILRVDPSTVHRWHAGEAEPPPDTRATVAALLTDPHERTPIMNARLHALHLESVEAELEVLSRTPGDAGEAYAHALAMLRGEVDA